MIVGPDQAAQQRWLSNRIDDLESDLRRAREMLAAYSGAVIPRADYQRVLDQRDELAQIVDGLTVKLQNASDRRVALALATALDLLQEAARLGSRDAGGPAEQDYRQRRCAFLAESGRDPWGGVL